MNDWDRTDASSHWLAAAMGLAALAVVAWTSLLASQARREPARCASGWVTTSSRCCAPGQREWEGHCSGAPTSCPPGTDPVTEPIPGCVAASERVLVRGGSLLLGPTDWDGVGPEERRIVSVRSFSLDRHEVTRQRYAECIRAGACSALPPRPQAHDEPGLPVTNVTAAQAETFCLFAGGRLPSPYEWLFAAAGTEARRYPWGSHGLVCRRAAFGSVDGPCARGGLSPELAGSRPEGASRDGLHDLAGNVAEYARLTDGKISVHGGSFRSRLASELKSWSVGAARSGDDVGFRCAYDAR